MGIKWWVSNQAGVQMEKWTERSTDETADRGTDRQTDEKIDRWIESRADRHIHGKNSFTGRWTYGVTNILTDTYA